MARDTDFSILNGLFRLLVLCERIEVSEEDRQTMESCKECVKKLLMERYGE